MKPFSVSTDAHGRPAGSIGEVVAAGIDFGNVRQRFVADLRAGMVPAVAGCASRDRWWARSVRLENDGLAFIVDDGNGRIIRLPFAEQDGKLTYGDPEVVVSDLCVAASASASASADDGQRVLASWSSKAESPNTTPTEVPTTMKLDAKTPENVLAAVRDHLNLPPWLDEHAVAAALRCAPPAEEIRAAAAARRPAVRAAAPAPRPAPRLDPATLQVSSDVELRGLAQSHLTTADRAAVADEIGHRQLMATAFPAAIKAPDGRVRIHHAA